MKPKYVIFDCDGVLVESEVLANRIEAEYKTELGFPTTLEEQIRNFTGLAINHPAVQAELSRLPSHYLETVDEKIWKAYEEELDAVAGIHETLLNLNLTKCVASNSGLDSIVRKLALTNLLSHFPQGIFSYHMVRKGKPAPDLFLYAAKNMQWNPEHCVVIEDSEAGVRAGIAAGMRVLGFTGGQHIQTGHDERLRSVGTELNFKDMRDLPEILEGL